MDKIVILILVAAFGIIFALVPSRTYNILTKTLSFDKKGIRYIRRRHDKVDALANLFLFIGLIFSVFYFVLPFYSLIYAVFLIFSFLCVLGQANRVLKKKNRNVYRIVIYGLYLMAAIGLVSALGLLNNHVADMMVTTYRTDLFAGNVFDIFYLLTNHSIIVYILQGILFFIPVYCMWSQFKYMRLENTYKAMNIFTYAIKVLFICIVMIFLAVEGFDFINFVYQVEYKEA